ncbi:hypothetical protein [Mucilaginibacter gilvus]|uniref:DUF3592 domain-containing protein n=1 Tax=Mucilaginibacter gilvus TaxID=2305909 RepID=A0A444MKD1_9SPHI|nr:hypothetical protein [Mucilaginibacter gilvus]RWY49267.1 hypothetical protein EPL05_17815 [Mucilaginibacter gilvus]
MKARDWFYIILAIALVGYFITKVALNSFTDNFWGDDPQIVKAVLIDEKNFMGNQPISHGFSYSYSFTVNGKQYTGNAHDHNLNIGDSVEAVYNKKYPAINKPLHPKD